MYLSDQFECCLQIDSLTGLSLEFDEIADGEGIGPQVAARLVQSTGQPGGRCKIEHNGPYIVTMLHASCPESE
jgi:hypothetical protein